MSVEKSCSFFGHRNAILNKEQINKLKITVENLILKENVKIFLFGSRSNFDSLCKEIVDGLKEKYPYIVKKAYTCKSEMCYLENEKEEAEKVYSWFFKKPVKVVTFDEEIKHPKRWSAGRASYVERNEAIINDSDFCIFFYDKKYQPEQKILNNRSLSSKNSGTALAFSFAKRKKKDIINIYNQKNI